MVVTMDMSDDCRRLAANLLAINGGLLGQVFEPVLLELKRNRFYRLFEEDGAMSKPQVFRPEELKVFAQTAAKVGGFDPVEVVDHIVDASLCTNRRLAELIRGQCLREQPNTIFQFGQMVDKYRHGAKKVVGWFRAFPSVHATDEVNEAYLEAQRVDLELASDLIDVKRDFIVERQTQQADRDDSKCKLTLGWLHSEMDGFVEAKGRHRFILPQDGHECLEHFAMDVLNERDCNLVRIDDREERLRPHLREWIKDLDGVGAIDDRFLILALSRRGGGLRIMLERSGDPQKDQRFDAELKLLYELLDCVDHETGRNFVLRMVRDEMDRIEQAYEKEHQDKMNQARPGRVRSPLRIWVPGQ